jgi:hypothetical protein
LPKKITAADISFPDSTNVLCPLEQFYFEIQSIFLKKNTDYNIQYIATDF